MEIQELVNGELDGVIKEKGLPVRVIWSRKEKTAKTQYRAVYKTNNQCIFDEKIQINTLIELDPTTRRPVKEKTALLQVALNKHFGYKVIASVEFDMAAFKYDKYAGMRLFLTQNPDNQEYNLSPEKEHYLEIGIKGREDDGLITKRMNTMRDRIADKAKAMMAELTDDSVLSKKL